MTNTTVSSGVQSAHQGDARKPQSTGRWHTSLLVSYWLPFLEGALEWFCSGGKAWSSWQLGRHVAPWRDFWRHISMSTTVVTTEIMLRLKLMFFPLSLPPSLFPFVLFSPLLFLSHFLSLFFFNPLPSFPLFSFLFPLLFPFFLPSTSKYLL